MKVLLSFFIFFFLLSNLQAQINTIKKTPVVTKAPKFVITAALSYDYAFSSNVDVHTFTQTYDPVTNKSYFSSSNYAMQFGLGILTEGKMAVSRNRKLRLTGELSYNHFYNTRNGGSNRTRWQFLNVGSGIEYNFQPKSKNNSFIGGELLYTLMWGAWQTDIIYPDGFESNIYLKFLPASRLGAAIKMGTEFRLPKNRGLVIQLRAVWANIAPKQNSYNSSAYDIYVNDSENSSGISLGSPKQVVFLQLMTGINFQIKK
jgi:hypothetical protein